MNDTHGTSGTGWYGFDLDGTLAKYDKWRGIDHIGDPIAPMVKLIKKMHEEGKVVKILTARVAPRIDVEMKPNPYIEVPIYENPINVESEEAVRWADESDVLQLAVWNARNFIEVWCAKNLGFVPEITHEKDHLMLELYDDRVKQVIPNEGVLVEDKLQRAWEEVARHKQQCVKGCRAATPGAVPESMEQNVNHPRRYTKGKVECIDALEAAVIGKPPDEAIYVANVIKYLWRYEEKEPLRSLKSAKWYLDGLIGKLESKSANAAEGIRFDCPPIDPSRGGKASCEGKY